DCWMAARTAGVVVAFLCKVISMLPLPGRMILPSRPAAPRGPSAGLVDYAATNHPGPDMYLSQSAITAAVSQLEARLGVKLFERLPRGVALTPEGHRFAQHARHI